MMNIQFEDKKEEKKGNEGIQALYINKEAHAAANEVLDLLKAKNKVLAGGKMTKKGIIEMAVEYFRDEVVKNLNAKEAAEVAAAEPAEPAAEEEEKPTAKKAKK